MIQENAMEDKKTTLEVIGPSIEDAIENGLDQLGLPRDAVDVEVLDQGQNGFLGIGNRQVRVRLTLINHEENNTVSDTKHLQWILKIPKISTSWKLQNEKQKRSLNNCWAQCKFRRMLPLEFWNRKMTATTPWS